MGKTIPLNSIIAVKCRQKQDTLDVNIISPTKAPKEVQDILSEAHMMKNV